MEKYKKSFINLFKNPTFIIPLIIVTLGSFGYLLGHSTVNVDTLAYDIYFKEGELIAQQRILGPILEFIFQVFEFKPFLVDFLAILVLIFDATLFCALIDVITNKKIKTIAYTIFSCFFVSYPLIMEYFTFVPMGLTTAIGFGLIIISLIAIYEYFTCQKNNLYFLGTVAILGAISLYESFAVVYIMGVLAIIIAQILFVNEEKLKLRKHIQLGFQYLVPFIIALLLNFVITNFILIIFHIPKSIYPDKHIMYFELGFIDGLKNLINTVVIEYLINALGYLPITFLVISSIASIVLGIILSIRKKDISILVVIIGMNITLLLLSIIQGKSARYRTCQVFQLFVPFIFMLLTQIVLMKNWNKSIKNTFLFLMFFMILYQVKDIYNWQYINDLRYQKEKSDLISIGQELVSKYDVANKPVVFLGSYKASDYLREAVTVKDGSLHEKVLDFYNTHFYDNTIKDVKNYVYTQTSVQSYINWGIGAFADKSAPNMELMQFYRLLGYDFKIVDMENFFEAYDVKFNGNMPSWPKEGSIIEKENYILVSL